MLEDRIALARAVAGSTGALSRAAQLFEDTRRAGGLLYILGDSACAATARFICAEAGRYPNLPTVAEHRPGIRARDLLLGLTADGTDHVFRDALAQARRASASTIAVTGAAARAPDGVSAWLRLPVHDPALVQEGQLAVWHDLGAASEAERSRSPRDTASASCASLEELQRLRPSWRATGRTLVWTNGCFDLIHAGHAAFLEQVRAQGDVLVVGLNSDASVRRLKGPERPFLDFSSRATVLRAMRAVDHVIPLRDDLPSREIGLLQPDICCKDESYATLPLPERPVVESYGGRMMLIPRIAGRSTTELAARIRGDGVRDGSR
jgi:D-glycero-beta-D-manno-heptose 1-phosphate adenylyltransferase